MALIKTIAEMRAVIPRLSKLSDTGNLPNVDKAGLKHIVPIIGAQLYETLDTKYNSSTGLSEAEDELLKKIQLPLAAFALLDDLAFIHSIITDNGIRTTTTASMEAAHRWEFNELKNALTDYAADGIEFLLAYLYSNPSQWLEWTDSDAFKELDSYLIKTGSDFKKYYPLKQPLRTYWALKPVMHNIEDNYLIPTFGVTMIAWLKTKDNIKVTTSEGEYDVLRLLKNAVANLTIKHAGESMAVDFSIFGFTIPVHSPDALTEGISPAGYVEKKAKLDAADREGQNYLSRVVFALKKAGSDNTLGAEFQAVFATSPLSTSLNKKPYTSGNENRRTFRMP